jgi:hypothetical protein
MQSQEDRRFRLIDSSPRILEISDDSEDEEEDEEDFEFESYHQREMNLIDQRNN